MNVTVVTATRVEAQAARKALPPHVRVAECGISLARQCEFEGIAISCGLAGGLRSDLPTGTVVVPARVRRPDGTHLECDAQLTALLTSAARELGYRVVNDPVLTSASLVYGAERAAWAPEYAAVDMETGLIRADRIACVRVILDTPQREISPAWLTPLRAALTPSAWRDLPFLAREGPRCSTIAAEVLSRAVRDAGSSAVR